MNGYKRNWRISYVPQIACVLREPSNNKNRLLNLGGCTSKGDLSNQHAGVISRNAKTKMRNAILWLDASAKWKWSYSKKTQSWFKWKLNFITLTLPEQKDYSDKFIKKILNKFFLYAYRKTGLRSYVWKAEPQRRGVIHFHVTSDCFIWKTTLQNIWNGCLRSYGLLGSHENPPSTQVKATKHIKLLTAYLIKYMTKSDNNRRTIQGRLWGCSRNLSQAKTFSITVDDSEVNQVTNEMKAESVRVDYYDWLSVYNLKPSYFDKLEPCEITKLYAKKIREIQTGYVYEKDYFFSEGGKSLSYQEAIELNLPKSAQIIHEYQQKIFSEGIN
jgi:hypothetical protein